VAHAVEETDPPTGSKLFENYRWRDVRAVFLGPDRRNDDQALLAGCVERWI
jgi:hypothetical protein